MSNVDLSPWRSAGELVDAIWAARRAARRDLQPDVVRLLDHEDPTVREEALSLLFVKWADLSERERLVQLTRSDPDPGVRSRAAGALGITSSQRSRSADIAVLRGVLLDRGEEDLVRRACYEALCHIAQGRPQPLRDSVDLDEDLDLTWVRDLR